MFSLIFATLRSATPLIFAALGGLFSERSGVINIALEGLMLCGAFTAAVFTLQTQNPYLGFLAGLMAGAVLASIYAIACIKFEADQVVVGMAINFLMIGLPALISGVLYDSTGSTPQIAIEYLLPNFNKFISSTTEFIVINKFPLFVRIGLIVTIAFILFVSILIFRPVIKAMGTGSSSRNSRSLFYSALGFLAWVVALGLMFYFSDRLSVLQILND